MKDRGYFGYMMVKTGEVDAIVAGPTKDYSSLIKPALRVIGTEPGVKKIAGMYILITKRGPLFLADATVNYNPTAEELADITMLVAKEVRNLNIRPRIAMLSYSNFGSSPSPEARLVAEARRIVKQKDENLIVDGEMQGMLALNNEMLKENYPFSELVGEEVNTLIFPNLAAGNIAYNLLKEIGNTDSIGPILLGMDKPVQVLQLGSQVRAIVNMTMIAVLDAQMKKPLTKEDRENGVPKWWDIRNKEADAPKEMAELID
jgi:malate dehydrogenase (oxaloacetate-decarboxylating)(NADP+)